MWRGRRIGRSCHDQRRWVEDTLLELREIAALDVYVIPSSPCTMRPENANTGLGLSQPEFFLKNRNGPAGPSLLCLSWRDYTVFFLRATVAKPNSPAARNQAAAGRGTGATEKLSNQTSPPERTLG